jgi:hypothetical protein
LIQCRHAEAALQHIDALGAIPERVYELTRARAYLDKAREEASEAHYGDAIRLAKASQDAADRARAPEEYGGVKGSF